MNDPETECIVMIGEIGGQLEADAAHWIKADGNRKPVVGFITGNALSRKNNGACRCYCRWI
jgi:succinyl-CoA synthetase alpha subunit